MRQLPSHHIYDTDNDSDLWQGISDEVSLYNGPRDVCLVGEILTSFKFRDAEELLQGSSDDEELERPIIRTFDTINEDGGNLLFSSPASEGLRDLHPSAVHIFRLWQTFLDSVNPVIKIFHAPTIQQKILEASADLDNIPKPMEALMFGIYCMSIRAFNNPDCKATFGEEKETLIARYHAGARQALLNVGFLRTSDMTILQALALFLVRYLLIICIQITNSRTAFMSQLRYGPSLSILPIGHRCPHCATNGSQFRRHYLWTTPFRDGNAPSTMVATHAPGLPCC